MSCEYKIVKVGTFRDEKFQRLSPNAKLTFFAVLCNTNHVGGWRYSIEQLAEETGLSVAKVQESLSDLCDLHILVADKKAKLLWFPRFFVHNPIGSWKRAKALVREFAMLPECELRLTIAASVLLALTHNEKARDEFRAAFEGTYRLLPTALSAAETQLADTLSAFCFPFPFPFPSSKEKKVDAPETQNGAAKVPADRLSAEARDCFEALVSGWNSIDWTTNAVRTAPLVRSFEAAWKNHELRQMLSDPAAVVAATQASDWLASDAPAQCRRLAWVLKPPKRLTDESNLEKLVSGSYRNTAKTKNGKAGPLRLED